MSHLLCLHHIQQSSPMLLLYSHLFIHMRVTFCLLPRESPGFLLILVLLCPDRLGMVPCPVFCLFLHTFHIVFGEVFSSVGFFFPVPLVRFLYFRYRIPAKPFVGCWWDTPNTNRSNNDVQITMQLVPLQRRKQYFRFCTGPDPFFVSLCVRSSIIHRIPPGPQGERYKTENYIRNWFVQGRHKFQSDTQRLGTAAGLIVSLTHRTTSIDSLTSAPICPFTSVKRALFSATLQPFVHFLPNVDIV